MSDRREPSVNRPRAVGARAALLLFLFACLVLAGRPRIHSDGTVYYAVSESLAADGDFDLANQRDLTDIEWRAVADFRSHGGRFASIYSGGIALLNLPFLWPALRLHDDAGFLKGLDALGASLDGIPVAFSVAILSASFVYLCLAALLTFEVVRRWISDWWAVWVTLAVMCSLPVVLFGVWEPSYSHTADAFLIALALWLTVRLAEAPRGVSWRLALIAAALGLATFVRVINVVLFVPWGVYLLWLFRRRGESAGRILGRVAVFVLGALPFAAMVLWYNAVSYGHPLRTAYHLQTGGMAGHASFGEGLLRWAQNVVYRLVDLRHGAVWWSPLCAVAAVGLLLREKQRRRGGLRQLALWCFVVAALVMGVWNVRGNRGHGAGPRFFIESFPFLAVGVAALVARVRRGRWLLGVGLAVLTLYSLSLQAARISWRAEPRVNSLLAQRFAGLVPGGPGPCRRLWGPAPRLDAPRPLSEWMMYTPFELFRAAFDDSVVAKNEPSRATSRLGRVVRGTEPSLRTLVWLSARGRLPPVVTDLTPTVEMERGRLTLACDLDRPLRAGARIVLDVFEYDRERRRRGRRWGRFVSADLAADPPVTTVAAVMDVETGTLRLLADGREVALVGCRLAADHRRVIAEADTIQFSVLLRPVTPLSRTAKTVIANPWRQP